VKLNLLSIQLLKKKEAKQFHDAHITLAEIETVKRVLFQKLINVYQLRVEYPK